jgi:hypothetical protein
MSLHLSTKRRSRWHIHFHASLFREGNTFSSLVLPDLPSGPDCEAPQTYSASGMHCIHMLGVNKTCTVYSRKVQPRHIPAVKFETQTIPRQPCSDGHDARTLVRLLMHLSRQRYPLSANFISKFMMSANFVRNSANLSSLSKLCQQFSKSVICKQFVSAIQQICLS